MNKYLHIGIILFSILLTSCNHRDNRLQFKNNSRNLIYVDAYADSDFSKMTEYFEKAYTKEAYDTTFNAFGLYVNPSGVETIQLMRKDGWERMVDWSETEKIYFFIIQDSIANKYGSKYVIKHHLCETQAYTLEELRKSNWVVTYPDERKLGK